MTDKEYAAIGLLNLAIFEDHFGKHPFIDKAANLLDLCYRGKCSREEYKIGIKSVIISFARTDNEDIHKLLDEFFKFRFFEKNKIYKWGDTIFTDDVMARIEYDRQVLSDEKISYSGFELLRENLTESDLEDMTQDQLKKLKDEIEIAFKRTLDNL